MPRKLTAKQEAFAQHYALHGKPVEAYRAAYDVNRMSNQAIATEAGKLRNHPAIARRIAEIEGSLAEKLTQEFDITRDFLLLELATIVKTGKTTAGRTVKTNEQIQAMGLLGRFMGFDKLTVQTLNLDDFVDDPRFLTFDNDGNLISPIENAKRRAH